MAKKYKRILLKLSGEALGGKEKFGIDSNELIRICTEIKSCQENGTEIAIVVGGGNFFRGRSNTTLDKVNADYIGMMATVMNALALQDTLKRLGCSTLVQTAQAIGNITEFFNRDKAINYLKEGKIVIFGGGTGSPFFSTDTAAALRAAEINADVIIKATNVDGVYSNDPKIDKDAIKYDVITFDEVIERKLNVMDLTAMTLCADNNIPIIVINLDDETNITKAINGDTIGTLVKTRGK